jgi:hypothetical protein
MSLKIWNNILSWSALEQEDWMHLVEVSMKAWLEQEHLKSVMAHPVDPTLLVKQVSCKTYQNLFQRIQLLGKHTPQGGNLSRPGS